MGRVCCKNIIAEILPVHIDFAGFIRQLVIQEAALNVMYMYLYCVNVLF